MIVASDQRNPWSPIQLCDLPTVVEVYPLAQNKPRNVHRKRPWGMSDCIRRPMTVCPQTELELHMTFSACQGKRPVSGYPLSVYPYHACEHPDSERHTQAVHFRAADVRIAH